MLVWRNTTKIKLFWQQTNITGNGAIAALLDHILYSIIDSRRDKLTTEKKKITREQKSLHITK